MKRLLGRLVLVLVVAGAAWAALAFPHVARVETGRTPEYPDLKPRAYTAPPAAVSKAVTAAVAKLGWTVVASGSGPGGSQVQTTATVAGLPIPSDVFIHSRAEHGRTLVSVKSEWRYGPWDFGQGARNIRALLTELDRQLP
jgi:hypothetical protein